MSDSEKSSGYLNRERMSAIVSTTLLVMASVFNFPSWAVYVIGVVVWFGIVCLWCLYALIILVSAFDVNSLTPFYASIAHSELKRDDGLVGQLLDNVPPLVSVCAWISLSWPFTAGMVFLSWLGVKVIQYRAFNFINDGLDEADLKTGEH